MFKDLEFVKRLTESLAEMGYTHVIIKLGLATVEPYIGYYAYEVESWLDGVQYANAGHIIIDAPFAEVERMIVDSFRRTRNAVHGVLESEI